MRLSRGHNLPPGENKKTESQFLAFTLENCLCDRVSLTMGRVVLTFYGLPFYTDFIFVLITQ